MKPQDDATWDTSWTEDNPDTPDRDRVKRNPFPPPTEPPDPELLARRKAAFEELRRLDDEMGIEN